MADLSPGGLWRLARRGVLFELRLYRSLALWIMRRPDVRYDDAQPVTYARTVTPVMWLWIFASAVEVPLVHILIPWDTVRIVVLVLSIWGLVWMVGLLASLTVYPHLLTPTAIRVRYGAGTDVEIPWAEVTAVSHERRDLESTIRTLQPRETDRGTNLQVAVSGQVNVHLTLREPTVVGTPKGDLEIVTLSFFADEPRPLVAAVREQIGSGAKTTRRVPGSRPAADR